MKEFFHFMSKIEATDIVATGLTITAILCVASSTDTSVTNNLITGLIGFMGGKVTNR